MNSNILQIIKPQLLEVSMSLAGEKTIFICDYMHSKTPNNAALMVISESKFRKVYELPEYKTNAVPIFLVWAKFL